MTDVLDRVEAPVRAEPQIPQEAEAPEPRAPRRRSPALALSNSARLLLATLSAAAGVIHLVMVPSHIDEWAAEGAAFAAAGWFQLGVAVLLFMRPSRALLRLTIAANVVLIGAWAVTRTVGSPWGPHSGHAESAGFVDLTTVGLEVAMILAAGLILFRPGLARVRSGGDRPSLLLPIGVVILATAALASPSARNHAGGAHGDHGDAAAHGGAAHADMTGHADDRGFSLLNNGHHGHIGQPRELAPGIQAELDGQLDVTRLVALAYPTVADALDAGYRRAGPFSPGLGTHYVTQTGAALNADGDMDIENLMQPLSLIYDGTDAGSELAGFMYYSMSADAPVGFAGGNDVWHYHEDLCLRMGPDGIEAPFGMDLAATPEQCASVGGFIMESTNWMVHVWSVPGYDEVPGGQFAEHNPALECSDGTYYQLPPEMWADHLLNICRSAGLTLS